MEQEQTKTPDPLLTMNVNLTFQVQEINGLLTILNAPSQTQTLNLIYFINAIQEQAGPQVEKFRAANVAPDNVSSTPTTSDTSEASWTDPRFLGP